ncbi:uncharacterized protein LOC114459411 isoform X2 [Gouania willdenowi]|uniref:uncharacterized protein LOC114459411 isoform X2 n=1 Tax=Gouania willdenowi TaxID=441366 RepID=UPI0010568853|nr:uncharacterized protein LOC114459411 isoform X2 [Gouania willdenowi]
MLLWRSSIALILGLVWYWSDCGRTLSQYVAYFVLWLFSPLLFGNSGRESATQTEEESEESPLQHADEGLDQNDGQTEAELLETQYPHVKKSLQQVFECAYAQLVLPWYDAPEPCEEQPLHQALSREVDFVISRIIERAKDFDVCQAVVGSIRILTQHLHNAKQSDREQLFSSRAEEVSVLRAFSDALVRNLFPKSLWGQEVSRCALSEIIAVKVVPVAVPGPSIQQSVSMALISRTADGADS